MNKQSSIELDYANLDKTINKKATIKLADVQDKIERVAFDVVRFTDAGNFDKLWVVKDEDGDKVLVAMYDEDAPELMAKASSFAWAAVSDRNGNINIFYKNDPITKFAIDSMGIPKEDASLVCSYLPEKLASDKTLVSSLLASLNSAEKNAVYSKYPELIAETKASRGLIIRDKESK